MPARPRFSLYSRAGCPLCDDMREALAGVPDASGYAVDVLDVDSEPEWRARYGHKVPVLSFDGELVCHGHLDVEELHKALACYRRPV